MTLPTEIKGQIGSSLQESEGVRTRETSKASSNRIAGQMKSSSRTHLRSNWPWLAARNPQPALGAMRPMSARASCAGRCGRRRGCRHGTDKTSIIRSGSYGTTLIREDSWGTVVHWEQRACRFWRLCCLSEGLEKTGNVGYDRNMEMSRRTL